MGNCEKKKKKKKKKIIVILIETIVKQLIVFLNTYIQYEKEFLQNYKLHHIFMFLL